MLSNAGRTFCSSPRTFFETNAFISFINAFISIADTFIPAKERGFSTADTIISASDTSLVATKICFPVAERTLGAVPTGVFLTPIRQQRTVRRKTMAQHIRTCTVSNRSDESPCEKKVDLILRAHDHTYQRTNQRR